MAGPLRDVRVIELAGLGPGPYCAMLLADLGADVVRIERPDVTAEGDPRKDVLSRGRRSVTLDVKSADGLATLLDLLARADVLLDPYRPGTTERLGLGPDVVAERNPKLVYARMTGWGQDGPLAGHAGHDINYIALAGALAHIGRAGEPPVPPMNLVGDMAGGVFMAYGISSALFEAQRSGRGQVIDTAMVDGVASLMAMTYGYHAQGFHSPRRGENVYDSGSFFYDVYECADGEYVSVGPIEFRFYANLMAAIGLPLDELPRRSDRASWAAAKVRIAEVFRARTRDEWCELLEPLPDLCFAPVLSYVEAPEHPHLKARGTFVDPGGVVQPAPVPRFSRTPGAIRRPPPSPGEHTAEVLAEWLSGSVEA